MALGHVRQDKYFSVVAIAPLGHALEDALEIITTSDGIKHRVKAFADDAKLVI